MLSGREAVLRGGKGRPSLAFGGRVDRRADGSQEDGHLDEKQSDEKLPEDRHVKALSAKEGHAEEPTTEELSTELGKEGNADRCLPCPNRGAARYRT